MGNTLRVDLISIKYPSAALGTQHKTVSSIFIIYSNVLSREVPDTLILNDLKSSDFENVET